MPKPYLIINDEFNSIEIPSPIGEKLVQQKMADIQEKMRLGQPVEGEYLTHLLLSDQMNLDEVLASITELLVAGVDTVGHMKELSGVKIKEAVITVNKQGVQWEVTKCIQSNLILAESSASQLVTSNFVQASALFIFKLYF